MKKGTRVMLMVAAVLLLSGMVLAFVSLVADFDIFEGEAIMKKGTKIALIVASALLLSGVVMVFVGFASVGFDIFELQRIDRVENTHRITESFENISINTDTAEVLLFAAEDDRCRVECVERENVYHTVTVENGTLTIRVVDERKWYEHIQIISQKMTIMVYLPNAEYGALDISTDTGKIEVPGDYLFSSVALACDTGVIDCRAKAQGNISLSTDTGAIRAEGTLAKGLQIESDTGTVSLSHVTVQEEITVENDTGKIFVSDVRAATLHLESNTGRQRLSDVVITGEMRLESDTGDIDITKSDAGEIYIKVTTGDVSASLLTPKICYASTKTGKVNVPRVPEGGRCEIETSTGDIDVRFSEH